MPHTHQPPPSPDGLVPPAARLTPTCTAQMPCPDCDVCARCRQVVRIYQTRTTVRGNTICEACCETHYWYCERCDGYNRLGDPCTNDCDDIDELIHEYYYRPQPVFHGTGPLFLGGEFEVATRYGAEGGCARLAVDHLGDVGYLKHDSSIGSGFEIVTHPMSYAWAMQHFPWQLFGELSAFGATATEATGIHVHLSRAGFSGTSHAYRWMKFIYRNQPQVIRLARRTSKQWAAFTEFDRRRVRDYAKGCPGDRYRAINTNNSDTFELRIFAGSLDPGQIKAALGFAAASVEYTRALSVADIVRHGGWQWPAFTDWLGDQAAFLPLREQLEVPACAF